MPRAPLDRVSRPTVQYPAHPWAGCCARHASHTLGQGVAQLASISGSSKGRPTCTLELELAFDTQARDSDAVRVAAPLRAGNRSTAGTRLGNHSRPRAGRPLRGHKHGREDGAPYAVTPSVPSPRHHRRRVTRTPSGSPFHCGRGAVLPRAPDSANTPYPYSRLRHSLARFQGTQSPFKTPVTPTLVLAMLRLQTSTPAQARNVLAPAWPR